MSEKDTAENEQAAGSLHDAAVNRRDAVKGFAAAAAGAAVGVDSPAQAAEPAPTPPAELFTLTTIVLATLPICRD
jgi:hypothetical protein